MTDTLELAKKYGDVRLGKFTSLHGDNRTATILFTSLGSLQAFRDACVKKQAEELQARIAMQDEALKAYQQAGFGQSTDPYLQGLASNLTITAISATSADVAAWQEKQLAPLQRGVAMLNHALLSVDAYLVSRGIENRGVTGRTVVLPKIRSALNDTKATAEAYEKEVAARAELEVLTECRKRGVMYVYDFDKMIAELRGETK